MSAALVLSCFPGIGLLDRAFEDEGFTVVRGPDVLWGGDIRRFHPPAERFDGVIGGPPCQMFSTLSNLVRANGHEPRFGNLIPEFERVVREARPAWFLMENVLSAPVPVVPGYAVEPFVLDNAWLGEEQMRRRRFSFGTGGGIAIDLLRWVETEALMLPLADRSKSVVHASVGTTRGGGRTPAVTGPGGGTSRRNRHHAAGRGVAVTGAHSGIDRPKGGHLVVYTFPEMCRLQGLPEDFLSDAPFTSDGKRKAVANGVPLPMGRAVARAVKEALASTRRMDGAA